MAFAQVDAGDPGRVEGAGDHQLGVRGPLDDVDVLVAQLADDAHDAGTLHADAGADRVDAVVIGLHGHLGALARDADDLLHGDQAVVDLRNLHLEELHLEQLLEEGVGGAGQDDVRRRVVLHLHALDDGADGVVLLEALARDLLGLGHAELVAVLVEDEDLVLPGLVHLAGEDLAHLAGVLLEDIGLLDVHDPALQVLADVQDAAAAEGGEAELAGVGVADLVVVVTGLGGDLFHGDLRGGILDFLHHLEVLVDLAVALVHVDDHVEVVGAAVGLGELGEEHILQDTEHGTHPSGHRA